MLKVPRNVVLICDHCGYRVPALETSTGRLQRRDNKKDWIALCPFQAPRNLTEPFHCPKQQHPRIEAQD